MKFNKDDIIQNKYRPFNYAKVIEPEHHGIGWSKPMMVIIGIRKKDVINGSFDKTHDFEESHDYEDNYKLVHLSDIKNLREL